MTKERAVKWLAFYAALLYSMRHVAGFFNSMDSGGWVWGWVAAFAIDATIAAAAHRSDVQQRGKIVTATVIIFTLLSVYANLDYTLATALGRVVQWHLIWSLDFWQLGKAVAVASPPLLIFGLAEVLKENDTPSTALALRPSTAPVPASTDPQVAVENQLKPSTPEPQPARRSIRLKRPARALSASTAPTMPRLQPSTNAFNSPSTDRKVEQLKPSTDLQPQTAAAVEVEDTEMQKAVDAVRMFKLNNNLSEVAQQQGISVEGVRRRIRKAYKHDPAWVKGQVPGWVESNQPFLSK